MLLIKTNIGLANIVEQRGNQRKMFIVWSIDHSVQVGGREVETLNARRRKSALGPPMRRDHLRENGLLALWSAEKGLLRFSGVV